MICQKNELDTCSFRFLFDLESLRHHVILDKRFADRESLSLEEGVRHRTADQKFVDFSFDEGFDDRDLVRNFRTAKDRDERTLGIIQSLAEKLELLLHQ